MPFLMANTNAKSILYCTERLKLQIHYVSTQHHILLDTFSSAEFLFNSCFALFQTLQ